MFSFRWSRAKWNPSGGAKAGMMLWNLSADITAVTGEQDNPFAPMLDWAGAQGAQISGGTSIGFNNLSGLKDASGQSLAEAIAALPKEVAVSVTGHSLGGTLTPVIALMLSQNEPDRQISSVNFAGMTPRNTAFAALFDAPSPMAGRTRRVFNALDSVSYGWNNVLAMRKFFDPAPKGGLFRDCVLGHRVDQVETLHQHMPDTYLSLLGAPPLPFSILFGTITHDGQSVQSKTNAATPVYHMDG